MSIQKVHYHGEDFRDVAPDGRACKCRRPNGMRLEPGTRDLKKVTCEACISMLNRWVVKAEKKIPLPAKLKIKLAKAGKLR